MDSGLQNVVTNFQVFAAYLIAAVAYFNFQEYDPSLRPANVPVTNIQQEYDFIIIGAGSAGNVVANRLSAISNLTVLLIEAGGPESVLSDTPLLNYNLWFSDYDWNYTTVSQRYACQATGGFCTYPRGRGMGGSSTLNDMVYVRGNAADYDRWSDSGNPGWSYQEILPYFLRSEDNLDPQWAGSPYHSNGGYLPLSRAHYISPLAKVFIQAGEEIGYPYSDVNGPSQLGFMITDGTVRNGVKCSTSCAFLNPIRNRTNLHISMRSLVLKINVDPNSKVATGVTFQRDGQNITVNARKEVILSAGAVNSPQILMLSGIGPAEHLQDVGIPVIQNLRVGDNFQDHFGIPFVFTAPTNSSINWRTSYENFSAILDYAQNRNGPLTSPIGVEVVAFVNVGNEAVASVPDTELLFSSFVPFSENLSLWATAPFHLHPTSRGRVRLRDNNPFIQPLIDPAYLTAEEDVRANFKAIQFLIQLVQTKAIENMGNQLYTPLYFLCSNYTTFSDDFIYCLMREYSVTIYHPVGTCKMGPDSDPDAVVDPRLRLYGVRNLRVVDASVIPFATSGNSNGPTIMVAERGADLILQDHGIFT